MPSDSRATPVFRPLSKRLTMKKIVVTNQSGVSINYLLIIVFLCSEISFSVSPIRDCAIIINETGVTMLTHNLREGVT